MAALDIEQTIRDAANQYGVDPDFAVSIGKQESGLNPAATSPKGAIGVMQLMPETAKSLGVDPHDVKQNIQGGVKYMRQLQDQFGDPQLVAAAYNAGPGAVQKYGGVPPYPETQSYVAKTAGPTGPQLPASTAELDQFFGVQRGTPSTGSAPAQPSVPPAQHPVASMSVADLDKAFGVSRGQPSASAGPQDSPGVVRAKQDFAEIHPHPDPSAVAANSSLFGLGPTLSGLTAGGLTMGRNALASVGIGKPAPYSAGDAYQAAREIEQGSLDAYGQAHPIVNTAANIAGMVGSGPGHLLSDAAEQGALRLVPRLATSIPGRVAARAAGTAAFGGAEGSGQAVSEGQPLPQVAAQGGASALLSVPFGLAGEGLGALGSRLPSRTAGAVLPPLLGAGAGAVYGTLGGPGVSSPEQGALYGALAGARVPGQKGGAEPTPVERATALDLVAGKGSNPEASAHTATAETLDQAPPESTTVEALGPRGQELVKQAATGQSGDKTAVQAAIEARSSPQATLDRLGTGLKSASAVDPELAQTDVESQLAAEREGLAQQVADSPMQTMKEIRDATGVDPVTAQMDIRDQIDAARRGPGKDAYAAALRGNGVWTPELAKLAEQPEVRRAMAGAARLLGDEAFVDNPALPPKGAALPPLRMTAEELRANVQTKAGKPGQDVTPADLLTYLRSGDNAAYQVAPEQPHQIPTDRMWDLTKQLLDKSVTRNAFGKVEPSTENHFAQVWSGRVRDATNDAIPGLREARATYGEPLSWDQAYSNGQTLGSGGKGAETSDAFNRRWNGLSPGEQAATKNGYLANMYRQVEGGRFNSEAYQTPLHDIAQRTMFGEEGARDIRNTLTRQNELKDQARSGGLLQKAAEMGRGAWTNGRGDGTADAFAQRYRSMSPPEQEIAQKAYLGELYRRIEANKFSPEDYLNSPFHKRVVQTLLGVERAKAVQQLMAKEAQLAQSGKAIAPSAKPRPDVEADHGGGAFGAVLGMAEHGLNPHAALQGFVAGKVGQKIPALAKAIRDIKVTPGVRTALDQIGAQSPQETARQLRMRASERRSTKLGESTLKSKLAKSALRGVAVAAGTGVTHALNGVGDQ